MLRATTLPRTRLPLVFIMALLVFALAAIAATRQTASIRAPWAVAVVDRPAPVQVVTRQAITESISCNHGFYVTGDMAGDASPATLYANNCESR